jgi:hypothetical protein
LVVVVDVVVVGASVVVGATVVGTIDGAGVGDTMVVAGTFVVVGGLVGEGVMTAFSPPDVAARPTVVVVGADTATGSTWATSLGDDRAPATGVVVTSNDDAATGAIGIAPLRSATRRDDLAPSVATAANTAVTQNKTTANAPNAPGARSRRLTATRRGAPVEPAIG